MKSFLIIFFILMSQISFSQKGEIDDRLVDRIGQSEAERIYTTRPDYYNFLIFEMNEGFEFIDKSEVKSNITKDSNIKKNVKPDIDKDSFDFKSYNISPLPNQEQYFKLKNDKVLKIKSQKAIKEAFLETGMQNSKSIAY